MVTQRAGAAEDRSLGILGISEPEERTYRCLLAQPGVTVPEIAHATSLSARTTQRLLDAIEAKGLVTHSPERPRRYFPASPDMAIEALILQRQEELQRARIAAQQLQQEVRAVAPEDGQERMVELITSREAERQALTHMNRTAQREVVALVRLPVRITRLGAPSEEDQHAQRQAQVRGVRYRTVLDSEYLTVPGAVPHVRSDMQAGEQVRVVPQLPLKMIIADRRVAVIPLDLNADYPDSPVLVVRSSALLDALYVLFEVLWERATPIALAGSGEGLLQQRSPDSSLPDGVADLVQLMAAGLNDKTIARELGVSVRTVERRVSELVLGLDARTRFQAGWLAALQLAAAGGPGSLPAGRRSRAS